MSVDIREATSKEIQKNIQVVKRMTKGMSFDENMGNVNWRRVRLISTFGYKFMPKAKGVSFKKYRGDGCRYEVALPKEMTGNNVICYIHGGGFVSGSASSSRGYSSMLAVTSGLRVFSVDYDLAPEHPFPAGFNNCCAVINEIRRLYPDSEIALVGESAGANLCIAVALKMKDKVSSVIVHSPFVDFTGSLERSEHEIDDFTVKEGCLKPLNDIYVAGNNAMDPYISPMYGDYNDFPPTFITCDYNETLFADSIWLYRKLQKIGIKVKMIQMKGAFHAFATTGTQAPETATILKENVEFIKENMACYNSF